MGQWRQEEAGPQRFARIATAVRVRVSTVDPETGPNDGKLFFRSCEETTANLSRGGVFVRSWEPLAAGRRVVVAIQLPGQGELQLVGQVAWTRRELTSTALGRVESPGYGIEFAGGSNAELITLDGYLKGLAPKSRPLSAAGARAATPQP
ncbi:MAG: hypothetical protein CL908_18020 [Deltaproteobacteria bacterium]|nr:hypothetical protein [Deltaproteobacteria bacterium]